MWPTTHIHINRVEKRGRGREGGREGGREEECTGGQRREGAREGCLCAMCRDLDSLSLPPSYLAHGTRPELVIGYVCVCVCNEICQEAACIVCRLVWAFEATAHWAEGMSPDTIRGAIFVDGFAWSLIKPHKHSSVASPLSHLAKVFETISNTVYEVQYSHTLAVYLEMGWWLEKTSCLYHGGTNWT